MRDVEAVLGRESGLGETQQIDGIKDVRFSLSVEPNETIEFGTEFQTRLANIAIVEDI